MHHRKKQASKILTCRPMWDCMEPHAFINQVLVTQIKLPLEESIPLCPAWEAQLHSVHEPNQVGEEWMRPFAKVPNELATPRRTMCGMIAALDNGIGDLHSHWKHAKGEVFWNNT